ncbi:hypothetical protein Tco_1479688 [Tanacetum coccineum]
MSLESHATVTYTSILSDYQEPSDAGSPGVIIYGYDGLPMDPLDPYVEATMQVPPSPDYVPGPKHPTSPFYVPEPEYPKYLVPDDDEVPLEDQPLPTDASPTALSPGYIVNSDSEEDSEDELEDGPTDYPADEGDDNDDDDSSEDDANHKALTIPAPAIHEVVSAFEESDETEPFEEDKAAATPPPPAAAEMQMRAASPPTPLSSPLPQIPSPSLPLSSPLPLPPPIILPRTRASMVLMRVAAPSTYCLTPPSGTPPLLPIPLPTPSAPLLLPSTDRRANIPKAIFPPRKRLCLALGPRFQVEESYSGATARPIRGYRVDYGFVGTLDAELRRNQVREMG